MRNEAVRRGDPSLFEQQTETLMSFLGPARPRKPKAPSMKELTFSSQP